MFRQILQRLDPRRAAIDAEAATAASAALLLLDAPPSDEAGHSAFVASLSSVLGVRRVASTVPHGSEPAETLVHRAARTIRSHALADVVFRAISQATRDLDQHNASGLTPLMAAISETNVATVSALLGCGASASPGADGQTPLELAATMLRKSNGEQRAECMAIMRAVVAHIRPAAAALPLGARKRPDPLAILAGGLEHEVAHDFYEAITELLKCGWPHHHRDNITGRQAIHYACIHGYWQTAAVLVNHGAQIDAPDLFGMTAVDYAQKHRPHAHELRAVLRASVMRSLLNGS